MFISLTPPFMHLKTTDLALAELTLVGPGSSTLFDRCVGLVCAGAGQITRRAAVEVHIRVRAVALALLAAS